MGNPNRAARVNTVTTTLDTKMMSRFKAVRMEMGMSRPETVRHAIYEFIRKWESENKE